MSQEDATAAIERDEERLRLLDARIECLERISGIPKRDSQTLEKIGMWITYQVNHKLAIFGTARGAAFAVLILLCNLAFVVGFSSYQMGQCTPNMGFIDGEFDPFVNNAIYRDPGNVFICTTEYTNIEALNATYAREFTLEDTGDSVTCSNRVPCTLRGFIETDYDLELRVCPVSHGGCRQYNCINDVTNESVPPRRNNGSRPDLVNPNSICGAATTRSGQSEEVCAGSTSVTYYTCPRLGTVVGAALGYLFLVEMVALFLVVATYFVCSGRRYTWNDLTSAAGAPTEALEEARRKRLSEQEKDDEVDDDCDGSDKISSQSTLRYHF